MSVQQAAVADAEKVLLAAAAAYRDAFGDGLLGAYALGSLAHGGFSPLVSDIDLGLMLADPVRSEDMETIELIARDQKARRLPLAERLSVFWGTPSTLAGDVDGGRFPPLDRLDLLESGRLLIGTDARAGLLQPTGTELLAAGAEFALGLLAGIGSSATEAVSRLGSMRPPAEGAVEEIKRPDVLAGAGARKLTKLVLFPIRFMFTAATGRVGSNDAAAAWYLARAEAAGKPLVAAALAWRTAEPIDNRDSAALLRAYLVPLYLHYIDDHIGRLESTGEVELARGFREWRRRLEA